MLPQRYKERKDYFNNLKWDVKFFYADVFNPRSFDLNVGLGLPPPPHSLVINRDTLNMDREKSSDQTTGQYLNNRSHEQNLRSKPVSRFDLRLTI
jgi:hypothetical protein